MSMMNKAGLKSIAEPAKAVPVFADVDVAVAGGGISGVFAAIAAARRGARTLVIDRFGALGGHLGPGSVLAAGLLEWGAEETIGAPLPAPAREIFERVEALGGSPQSTLEQSRGSRTGGDPEAENFPKQSAIFAHVVQERLHELGAEFLLSAYAADPILAAGRVRGLFVETKSGRVAVTARVVVDGTGDADLAFRAGAPTIRGVMAGPGWEKLVSGERLDNSYRIWNECGLFYAVAGVDWNAWDEFRNRRHELTAAEAQWESGALGAADPRIPRAMIPLLKAAAERGEFSPRVDVNDRVYISCGLLSRGGHRFRWLGNGMASCNMQAFGEIDTGDARMVAELERSLRDQIFKSVEFLRRYVPGFQQAYLFHIAPYMGSRGGRCIDGEHTITVDDMLRGARFPDVVYVNFHEFSVARRGKRDVPSAPYDVPYRAMQPKGLDGLLVAGLGVAFLRRGHDPSSMRAKCSMMTLGLAAGTAAALASRANLPPKQLEVRRLQRELLADGFFLGDAARLRELGLGNGGENSGGKV